MKSSDQIINCQFSLFKNDLCKVILREEITAKKHNHRVIIKKTFSSTISKEDICIG